MSYLVCYTIRMKIENTVILTPTSKASKRTKERIKQHGPTFTKEGKSIHGAQWLLRSGKWLGWIPRNQFHARSVGTGSKGTMVLTREEEMER